MKSTKMKSAPRVLSSGVLVWTNEFGDSHREGDKPSYIKPNGYMQFRINGQIHREENKPAVITHTGEKRYYRYGVFLYSEKANT